MLLSALVAGQVFLQNLTSIFPVIFELIVFSTDVFLVGFLLYKV